MSVCHLTVRSSALSDLRVLVARGFDLDTLSNYQHEDDNLEVTSHTCLSLVLWRRPLEPCIHSCHLEQTPMDHLADINLQWTKSGLVSAICERLRQHAAAKSVALLDWHESYLYKEGESIARIASCRLQSI